MVTCKQCHVKICYFHTKKANSTHTKVCYRWNSLRGDRVVLGNVRVDYIYYEIVICLHQNFIYFIFVFVKSNTTQWFSLCAQTKAKWILKSPVLLWRFNDFLSLGLAWQRGICDFSLTFTDKTNNQKCILKFINMKTFYQNAFCLYALMSAAWFHMQHMQMQSSVKIGITGLNPLTVSAGRGPKN